MKLSVRDRWLCAALPAMVTAGVYVCVAVRHDKTHLAPLRRQSAALPAAAAPQESAAQREVEHARLAQALEAEIARVPALAALRKRLAAPDGDEARTETLREVSRLCERSGTTLLAAGPAAGGRLPDVVRQSAQDLAGKASAEPPLWRLELRGSYPAMVALLESLSSSARLIVPVAVTLKPRTDESRPLEWVVTVWI